MSTWGEILFFNLEEKQIVDLGLEKAKMKDKMRKKVCQSSCETSKQINIIILNIPA